MRQKSILIALLGLCLTVMSSIPGNANYSSSFSFSVNHTDNDSLLKATWNKFSKAVLNKDKKLLKSLSTDCIHCSCCVTNTQKEDSLFEIYRKKNEDTWYDKLYTELCFIPINKFISEDFNSIFNQKIKERLLDSSKLRFADDNHNARLYHKSCIIGTTQEMKLDFREVLLISIDPTLNYEGAQFAFAFVKLNGQYKFCGFSTIP